MQKRRTLWGALGQPSEKASVTTVSSGSLAINALTYSGCAPASVAAMKRVPTLTPEAPAARTAAKARPLPMPPAASTGRSEEHTSELQSPCNLVCRLLLEKKKKKHIKQPQRQNSDMI